ncbi:hypothetical protein MMC13_005580 [Lambiella insularis]|nr:hypothetical protein [Lambiella insularis]
MEWAEPPLEHCRGKQFQAKTGDFLAWFQCQDGVTLSPKVRLADLRAANSTAGLPDRGRGIVALQDIEENEELFSIPNKVVLSVETSQLGSLIPELAELQPWLALVMVLMYECGLRHKSRWFEYLELIPCSFDTLIYWTSAELNELQGSAVLLKIGKADAEKVFVEFLLPLVKKYSTLLFEDVDKDEYKLCFMRSAHRMASIIMAYGFDIEKDERIQDPDEEGFVSDDEDNRPKGMVPMADMLNADGKGNNARLYQGDKALTMLAIKAIKKGEEILNDYGPLPQSDLLRRYGYVSNKYRQWDVVEIDSQKIKAIATEQTSLSTKEIVDRIHAAEDWQLWEENFDIARQAGNASNIYWGFDPALLQVLQILTANKADFEKIGATKKPPRPVINLANVQMLIRLLDLRKKDFATSIETDRDLLDEKGKPIQGRYRMAIEIRLAEKEIIQTALDDLFKMKDTLSPKQSTSPKRKKRTHDNGQLAKRRRN